MINIIWDQLIIAVMGHHGKNEMMENALVTFFSSLKPVWYCFYFVFFSFKGAKKASLQLPCMFSFLKAADNIAL